MIAFFLAPIYLLIIFYILRWLLRWMKACHHIFERKWVQVTVIFIVGFVALTILIAFLLPASPLQRVLKLISNYWLGTLLYIILTVVIVDIFRIILKHCKWVNQETLASRKVFVAVGTFCVILISTLSIYGIINANNIQTTDYEVSVDKDCGDLDSLNVVLIADLHLGYSIGNRQMTKMVNKINQMDADLVVIAGDIFDNEYEALEDPEKLVEILKGIETTYGVYACYGNHDIQEKILAGFTFDWKAHKESDERMDQLLADADINLLQDEGVLIDNSFYVYGRPDYERPGRGIEVRKTPAEITSTMDSKKPILIIDHEPHELQELADAGVDLDLCGHTHDGQMFPGNLTIDLMWENACGYLQKDGMHNIVTSGIGVFGPAMRVGTKSEICNIKVTFK
ncbi:metallophosphoesterase [Lachnospiraceae bacterium OttesenSCG-928-E19]|nr:metallophosphoesterase [Lachnospiraceae bacterium OttesenSCG-928-E19]